MRVILFLFLVVHYQLLLAQCDPTLEQVFSSRVAHYDIEVELDNEKKFLSAKQKLTWVNHSPDPVYDLKFYMYPNAFKNTESSFLKATEGSNFGDDIAKRPAEDWGWIEVSSAVIHGNEMVGRKTYYQHDDGNDLDETVLRIILDESLPGGDTITIDLIWEQKIPKIFSRHGYQRQDFYNMVHWYPQIGVWEQDREGKWDWNCHQAHRRTEFYADFGVYDVSLTLPDHLIVGASGCETSNLNNGDGTKTIRYHAEDVIDFAWCAYPHFHVVEDQWEHVFIRLLVPPEHCHHRDRLIATVKHSLEYMSKNVGPYPYNSITIMDPPLHALRSGFMEYPTYITGGSFAIFPSGMHTMESLIAHEFAHQYFMAIVATNEKEEPWLDEGFVTYHEDKIMESMYGTDGSLFDILGYKVNNSSFSRHEYVALPNPSCGAIARSGWEINEGFKGITYSKTATMLKTMEGMMGEEEFVRMIQGYYKAFQFKHPRGEDFKAYLKSFLNQSKNPNALGDIDDFFDQIIYGTDVLDYKVSDITYFTPANGFGIFGEEKAYQKGEKDDLIHSKALIHRVGGVILPVEIQFTFDNGDVETQLWSGEDRSKFFYVTNKSHLVTVEIDPEQKLYLDINLNNNSLTYRPKKTSSLKVAGKVMYYIHNLIQAIGLLI